VIGEEATDLPVEISACVFDSAALMPLSVCSATIALLLVRILDIRFPSSFQRFCTRVSGAVASGGM